MSLKRIIATHAALLVMPLAAGVSQTPATLGTAKTPAETLAVVKAGADASVDRKAGDPSMRSGDRDGLPRLNLTATTGESIVKAQASVSFAQGFSAGLSVNAPVDEKGSGGRTTVADRDGLSHSASIEGTLRYRLFDVAFDKAKLDAACAEAERLAPARGVALNNFFLCSTVSPIAEVRQLVRDAYSGTIWSFQGSGGWGREVFKWTDATTLVKSKTEEEIWKFQGSLAVLFDPVGRLSASVARQHVFEAQPSTQLCVPKGAPGVLVCSSTALAAPVPSDETLAVFEWRRFLSKDYAASIITTYNVTEKETSVEVPLYFVADANGKLNGGVAALWSTDDRRVRYVFFIGTVFKLIP